MQENSFLADVRISENLQVHEGFGSRQSGSGCAYKLRLSEKIFSILSSVDCPIPAPDASSFYASNWLAPFVIGRSGISVSSIDSVLGNSISRVSSIHLCGPVGPNSYIRRWRPWSLGGAQSEYLMKHHIRLALELLGCVEPGQLLPVEFLGRTYVFLVTSVTPKDQPDDGKSELEVLLSPPEIDESDKSAVTTNELDTSINMSLLVEREMRLETPFSYVESAESMLDRHLLRKAGNKRVSKDTETFVVIDLFDWTMTCSSIESLAVMLCSIRASRVLFTGWDVSPSLGKFAESLLVTLFSMRVVTDAESWTGSQTGEKQVKVFLHGRGTEYLDIARVKQRVESRALEQGLECRTLRVSTRRIHLEGGHESANAASDSVVLTSGIEGLKPSGFQPPSQGLDSVQPLTDFLLERWNKRDLYSRLLSQADVGPRIFLSGPEGSGKTTIVRSAIAALPNGITVLWRNASSLMRRYLGSTERKLVRLFDRAKRASPCILVIDDIDRLIPVSHGHRRRLKRESRNKSRAVPEASTSSGSNDPEHDPALDELDDEPETGFENTKNRSLATMLVALDGLSGGGSGSDTSLQSASWVSFLFISTLPPSCFPSLTRPGRLETHVRVVDRKVQPIEYSHSD